MSCFYCGGEGERTCPDCPVRSCPGHLGLHTRGGACQLWTVAQVEGAGRGLLASRNIQAGEVVLRDWALVEGPLEAPGAPACTVCLQAGEGEVAECKECRLPLCKSRSKGCSGLHKRECEVLAGGGNQVGMSDLYTMVAVVRLVWQAERDPAIRAMLDPLMDHREGEEEEGRRRIATFLAKRGLEEETVLRLLGVLQTNGVTSQSVGGVPRAHALYPVFSITNHSCVSNTRHGREGEAFCLVATTDIPQGAQVTTSYNSTSLGTIVRRPQFRRLWHFDCSCPRCSDPGELGTLASALTCSSCPGHLLPQLPLDYSSQWSCARCGATKSSTEAEEITLKARQLEEAGRGGVEELEASLHQLVQIVHPRHYTAMQVKRMLCLMYGNCASHRLDTMKEKDLKRKAELCREYIAVFSILEPGLTKWRGRLCEELARTLVRLQGRSCVEALRLLGESGKCRKLDSQAEQAAFSMRMANMMSG